MKGDMLAATFAESGRFMSFCFSGIFQMKTWFPSDIRIAFSTRDKHLAGFFASEQYCITKILISTDTQARGPQPHLF